VTRKSILIFVLSCTVALMMSKAAFSTPIVTYSVSGTSGNWTLDFSVTNNLNLDRLNIMMFGVELPAHFNNNEYPTNWTPNVTSWNPQKDGHSGGSNTTYNNIWVIATIDQAYEISPNHTLNGFSVLDTADVVAPTSVNWFAYARLGNYNPVFEGIATDPPTAVPEPSTFLLFGAGLAGFGLLRKRLKS
jgi:hypothetical protein